MKKSLCLPTHMYVLIFQVSANGWPTNSKGDTVRVSELLDQSSNLYAPRLRPFLGTEQAR